MLLPGQLRALALFPPRPQPQSLVPSRDSAQVH